ncbi:MAG: aminoglycoside 3'-phosphotransferase/choline kinase family protein [Planctomycetes bacterium]|nr:aminoglycoside 3'-phosphotransferase/choline kinase family protein [Planctomycetota bacterium]
MESLPPAATREEYADARRDEARFLAGAARIARRHGLSGHEPVRFAAGSLPVFALGTDLVLKLYPPCFTGDFAVESGVLRGIAGRLPVPTPAVRASGRIDGWDYLVMDRLRGMPLSEAWSEMEPSDRARLGEDLGRTLVALHAVDHAGLPVLRPGWPAFLREQRETCVARQRAAGLGEEWLARIPAFLDATELPPDAAPVLLHTEVMREHLFVTRDAGGWRLSGLIDFEPSMAGAAEYEFAAVGLFVTCGEREPLRRLLLAYGYRPADLGEPLQQRFLAYTLLHRYANLRWYLGRLPPPPGAETLEALARFWWAL